MKDFKICCTLLLGLLLVNTSFAQEAVVKEKRAYRPPAPFQRAGVSLLLWQERIEAKKAEFSSNMETQFQGLKGHHSFNIPFNSLALRSWRQVYSAELAAGRVKGKGNTLTIADELKDQPWYSLGLSGGIMARATAVSEFGIAVPLQYRSILWSLKGNGLEMDKDQSFSVGLSAIFVSHLSRRSLLNVSLTYQQMWETAIWAVGWEYRL